jgi:hypothetical protein
MNTTLYASQIVIAAAVLLAGLGGSASRKARLRTPSTSVTTYADIQVAGANGLLGGLFAVAALVSGVAGLVGATVVPAPLAFLLTMFGLMSVLLATDTTPQAYVHVTEDLALADEPRLGAVVVLPTREKTAADSVAHAA